MPSSLGGEAQDFQLSEHPRRPLLDLEPFDKVSPSPNPRECESHAATCKGVSQVVFSLPVGPNLRRYARENELRSHLPRAAPAAARPISRTQYVLRIGIFSGSGTLSGIVFSVTY